ncbi:protein dopey-1-like isoform X2 [Anneissia japonica]|uniref:protein dopey-1-like isoform X2 n=1 Tax=Anneissia japonica TaxID=1529436 RepID=UPI0014257EF3|nr:protein dopey-1-like isoform X2 [Anneissia japonica]
MNLDEADLLQDPKFKTYSSAVEKALKGFEYSSEWADLISALGKLNRALQLNSSRFHVIPKRLTIGKRLAQCTHPALPSGVHLKALETYELIFKIIPQQTLCQDMFIYSAGIFPLLGNAAMSVKPALLSLYEEYYLPLGEHLKPALTGLLQGILPGLEEGSEYYLRTQKLLEQLCSGMDKASFYSALWDCVLMSPGVRLQAITFALSQVDRKISFLEQPYMMGSNSFKMVQAISESLEDAVVLVQRSALDLLLLCFPLNTTSIQQNEIVKMMTSALNVLLRRDMSLNRRLYAWFLGISMNGTVGGKKQVPPVSRSDSAVSTDEDPSTEYFEKHSKDLLIQALKNCLHADLEVTALADDTPSRRKLGLLRPYRILISLLDKPEVTTPIIDEIYMEVFRALYNRCHEIAIQQVLEKKPQNHVTKIGNLLLSDGVRPQELIKTANLLFGTFEPYFMWEYVAKRFDLCCQQKVLEEEIEQPQDESKVTISELCMLVEFLLDIVSLEAYVEIPTEHLPQLLCKVTMSMTNYCEYLSPEELKSSLQLCNKLLTKVQPSMVTSPLTEEDMRITDNQAKSNGYLGRDPPERQVNGDISSRQLPGLPSSVKSLDRLVSEDHEDDEKPMDKVHSLSFTSDTSSDSTSQIEVRSSRGLSQLSLSSENSCSENEKTPPVFLMQACVQCFQSFFAKFVGSRVLPNPDLAIYMEKLRVSRSYFGESKIKKEICRREHKDNVQRLKETEAKQTRAREQVQRRREATERKGEKSDGVIRKKSSSPEKVQKKNSLKKKADSIKERALPMLKRQTSKVDLDREKEIEENRQAMMKKLEIEERNFLEKKKKEEEERYLIGIVIRDDGKRKVDANLMSDQSTQKYLNDVTLDCDRSDKIHEAFSIACHLLVEYTCFPMYCNDSTLASTLRTPKGKGALDQLPDWLQTLITTACFITNVNHQSTAVGTLLELIGLTRSVTSGTSNKLVLPTPPTTPGSQSGTVSVVLIPAIAVSHLECLSYESSFFQRVAVNLWRHMNSKTPERHHKSAELLHHLHNSTPDVYLCEDVIGHSLVHSNRTISLEAHNRFALLWHLIRPQILNSSPASGIKTFDRSLLVMLDSLQHQDSVIRSVTQTWLAHAIERGDIARLLEPVLLILLDPKTSRVSVQFLLTHSQKKGRITKPQEKVDDIEAKICSISGVNGEVTYHVTKDGKKPVFIPPERGDPIFACTTIGEEFQCITRVNPEMRYEVPSETLTKPLKLTVNPMSHASFSDSESEPVTPSSKGGQFDKRSTTPDSFNSDFDRNLSFSTCDLTGIGSMSNLVEAEQSYVFNEDATESIEEIVQDVLEAIIDQVVLQVDDSSSSDDETSEWGEGKKLGTPKANKSGRSKAIPPLETVFSDDTFIDDLEGVLSGMETDGDPDSPKKDWSPKKGRSAAMRQSANQSTLNALQHHILLYVQVFDAQRSLYVLSLLKSVLTTNPRPFVCAMSSTSLSSANTTQLIRLQHLLARHKTSIMGRDFFSEVAQDSISSFRSSTYLDIVLSICVYFIRSYYPKDSKASEHDVTGNRDVQIASMDILRRILNELVEVVKMNGRGFATFISDLLQRCKVQKAVLYCLLASVFNSRKQYKKTDAWRDSQLIKELDNQDSQGGAQAFQSQLLRLILIIIVLEDQLFTLKDDTESLTPIKSNEWDQRIRVQRPGGSSLSFLRSERLCCQGMLLTAILCALRQQHICHMHRHWITVVTDALPYLDKGLPKITVPMANQLCRNLELLASLYDISDDKKISKELSNVPPDHVITILEGLTTMCHYSLLESTANLSTMSGRHGTGPAEVENNSNNQIFSSIFGAFSRDKTKGNSNQPAQAHNPKHEARKGLLGMLPRIVSSIATLWNVVQQCERLRENISKPSELPDWSIGSPKAVRQQILELLSPIALHHNTNLLAAIGVVWSNLRNKAKIVTKKALPQASDEQLTLVDLITAIRALPTDTLIQTIKQVLKVPPFTIKDKNQPSLEVSMLQFLYAYVQRSAVMGIRDSWPSLLSLLRDGLQLGLSPPGQFMLFGILNEFVHRAPPFEERKDIRDLQDITQKLIEACNVIAGSSLEPTTWLRRNVSVKFEPQKNVIGDGTDGEDADALKDTASVNAKNKLYSQYSVHALTILAELLSLLLDLVYGSDEKDKVLPLLTSIMHNVTPYLRNHSAQNVASYRACTNLVASLSGYQYTRRAWKKDAFELLLDPAFFQMDAVCANGWRSIVDNLMTHDKTTFRDLMGRVAAIQNTSLNLFTSREQEMDQRAQLLKRLCFTLFCSETDQYVRLLPDIQERLAECLRLVNVPVVHEQVFMCFRVLLLRISPHHLTGLWPTMMSELVQVFLHMEEQLKAAQEQGRSSNMKRVPSGEFSIFGSNGNGPVRITREWLGCYLAACKFLDLALSLPTDLLPQFQVYKWAFIGTKEGVSKKDFTPHITRVAKILNNRKKAGQQEKSFLKRTPGRPLLSMYRIKSLEQLLPFFNTICDMRQLEEPTESVPIRKSSPSSKQEDQRATPKEYVERLTERDFLIPLS